MASDSRSSDPSRLIEDASKGDADAVLALLARYSDGIRAYVQHHLRGPAAAKESTSDLVQSVCRELFEHLGDRRFVYRGEAEFKQWLYGAALLKVQDRQRHWRAEKRDVRREQPPATDASTGGEQRLVAPMPSPATEASRREDAARLERALEQLSEQHRAVVRLFHFEGLGHAEIAARLGISEGNSRVLLSRALARLAKTTELE